MKTSDELFDKINDVMLSRQEVVAEFDLVAKEIHNQALEYAAQKIAKHNKHYGMGVDADVYRQIVLNLKK